MKDNDVSIDLVSPQHDIGYLLWYIFKIWQRGKNRILEDYGVTISQLEVMGAIYMSCHTYKEVTQVMVSQETGIDPMTVSTIIRNLQKKNLIMRTESTTDTRARVVKLTTEGTQLFSRAIKRVREEQSCLLKDVDVCTLQTQLEILLSELNNYYNKQ